MAECLSLYEQKRAENIQRNGIVLQQMGLRADLPRAPNQQPPSRPRQRPRDQVSPAQPVRKSARLSNMQVLAAPNVYLDDEWEEESDRPLDIPRKQRQQAARDFTARPKEGGLFRVLAGGPDSPVDDKHQVRAAHEPAEPPSDTIDAAVPPPAPVSVASATADAPPSEPCKRLRAHLEGLRADFLGKAIVPTDGSGAMKAAVMARLRGPPYKVVPPFNKYSGMLEWANALAFFVNAEASNYDNTFLAGGRQMHWQAQNTQRLETPVIQRLLSTMGQRHTTMQGPEAAADEPGVAQGQGVALEPCQGTKGGPGGAISETARMEASSSRATLALFLRQGPSYPYVFCGYVSCLKFEEGSHPLSFVFELLDFDRLRKCEDFCQLFPSLSAVKP